MSSGGASSHLVSRFTVWDYLVFGAMLCVSAAIGIYYAVMGIRRRATTDDFLMGGRSMSVFPVALSILASFMSAITLLGTASEMYIYGTQYLFIIFSYCLVIPATAYLYMPVFYSLQVTSAYEYLELRFNHVIRALGCITFSVQMLIYMAIVLYAPALALSQVTGITVWTSVLSIGIVCTFYTSLGGMKAVIWTDVFQICLMFGSMLMIAIRGAYDIGGMKVVFKRASEGDRVEFFNFNLDPTERHTVWGLIIGCFFTWMSIYAVSQAMVQRYLTVSNIKGARIAIWINLPGLAFLMLICALAGLVMYARYQDCDPLLTKKATAPDQVHATIYIWLSELRIYTQTSLIFFSFCVYQINFSQRYYNFSAFAGHFLTCVAGVYSHMLLPLYVMDILGSLHGIPGLFVSGIFSGALSTVSSGVNSLAAVTLEDIIKRYIKKDMTDRYATNLTKIIAMAFGVVAIALVYGAQNMGNVLQAALSIFGIVGGPLLGVFTLGMFFPCANSIGAGVGTIISLAACFWIGFGAFAYKPAVRKAPVSVLGCINDYLNATGQDVSNITYPRPVDIAEANKDILFVYRISYVWYSMIGCVLVVVIGLIVSLLTGCSKPSSVNPRAIHPIYNFLCRVLLPSSLHSKFMVKKASEYDVEHMIELGKSKKVLRDAPEDGNINAGFVSGDEKPAANGIHTMAGEPRKAVANGFTPGAVAANSVAVQRVDARHRQVAPAKDVASNENSRVVPAGGPLGQKATRANSPARSVEEASREQTRLDAVGTTAQSPGREAHKEHGTKSESDDPDRSPSAMSRDLGSFDSPSTIRSSRRSRRSRSSKREERPRTKSSSPADVRKRVSSTTADGDVATAL